MADRKQNLEHIRENLQEIDEKILELFSQRQNLAAEVYREKKQLVAKIYDQEQEVKKLKKLENSEDEAIANYGSAVLSTLMRLSRAKQYSIARPESLDWELGKMIAQNQSKKFPVQLVATQGNAYSYSAKAATLLFPGRAYFPHRTFEEAILSVVRGQADACVLPLENSTGGTVDDVYQLIQSTNLYITDALYMPVRHCLLVKPGTRLQDIETVVSHKQALAQCSQFIRENKWDGLESLNTAFAAEEVSQGDHNLAAIATEDAAEAYGLEILEREITDVNQNQTRFVVVRRNLQLSQDAHILSLLLRLPHSAGSLGQVLSVFSDHKINMTKIQSSPIPRNPWEYYFYVDLQVQPSHEKILDLLYHLQHECTEMRLLGWYQETKTE